MNTTLLRYIFYTSYTALILRFTNLCKVGKRCFLSTNSNHLRWSHYKLLLLSSCHFRVFIVHNLKHTLEQLIICVVTIWATPCLALIFCTNRKKIIWETNNGWDGMEIRKDMLEPSWVCAKKLTTKNKTRATKQELLWEQMCDIR